MSVSSSLSAKRIIYDGIPGITLSASYSVQAPNTYINSTTAAMLTDPATLIRELAANLAQQLIFNGERRRLLRLSYGISVNIPHIASSYIQIRPTPTHHYSNPYDQRRGRRICSLQRYHKPLLLRKGCVS
ncbi:hypothetical protein EG329_007214 [Mollisiaceae sp. DMI_Dod_QoI]|nr:hypothetical protein EG329_007214 [Helotiales sp. DMI_Dod_QoI]